MNEKKNGEGRKYVAIGELLKGRHTGKSVSVRGWIYITRTSGKLVFVIMRDHSGEIQCTVFEGAVSEEDFEGAEKALVESSVMVSGEVVEDERAPGGYEIQVEEFEVEHFAETFPITRDHSETFLLDNRHLWLRSRKMRNIMKIKNSMLYGAYEYFEDNDFYQVTPPIITTNACEGGTTLFDFKFFDKKAYLSQSAQLYLEAAVFSLEKVWALTPSFRAEKSRTTRHLAEYWHLEAEEAWVDNRGNMKIQEELVTHMVHRVAEECSAELEDLGRDPEVLERIEPPFEAISYMEAVDVLGDEFDIEWGDDFGTREEQALTEDKTEPVFVYNYPKECKAFYMKVNPGDPSTYLCADMLAPEGYGEMIGGSERETDNALLIERIERDSVPKEAYDWYLDLRKYGSVPHSGFGLGVERVMRWVCGLEKIWDAIPFPRTKRRYYP